MYDCNKVGADADTINRKQLSLDSGYSLLGETPVSYASTKRAAEPQVNVRLHRFSVKPMHIFYPMYNIGSKPGVWLCLCWPFTGSILGMIYNYPAKHAQKMTGKFSPSDMFLV